MDQYYNVMFLLFIAILLAINFLVKKPTIVLVTGMAKKIDHNVSLTIFEDCLMLNVFGENRLYKISQDISDEYVEISGENIYFTYCETRSKVIIYPMSKYSFDL